MHSSRRTKLSTSSVLRINNYCNMAIRLSMVVQHARPKPNSKPDQNQQKSNGYGKNWFVSLNRFHFLNGYQNMKIQAYQQKQCLCHYLNVVTEINMNKFHTTFCQQQLSAMQSHREKDSDRTKISNEVNEKIKFILNLLIASAPHQ